MSQISTRDTDREEIKKRDGCTVNKVLFFLDKYTTKLYFSNFLMEKTEDMPTYKENEKVLCYHDKLLYEVKTREKLILVWIKSYIFKAKVCGFKFDKRTKEKSELFTPRIVNLNLMCNLKCTRFTLLAGRKSGIYGPSTIVFLVGPEKICGKRTSLKR